MSGERAITERGKMCQIVSELKIMLPLKSWTLPSGHSAKELDKRLATVLAKGQVYADYLIEEATAAQAQALVIKQATGAVCETGVQEKEGDEE
jgi:hypothetical protein